VAGLGGLGVDHRQEVLRLGDRVVARVPVVVGAPDDALLVQLGPVAGEGVVAEGEALGRLDDAELGRAGDPVVVGLVVRDVLPVCEGGLLLGGGRVGVGGGGGGGDGGAGHAGDGGGPRQQRARERDLETVAGTV